MAGMLSMIKSSWYWNRTWNQTLYLLNEVISHAQSFNIYFEARRKRTQTYRNSFNGIIRIRKPSDSMSCFTNNGYELDLFQPVRYGN